MNARKRLGWCSHKADTAGALWHELAQDTGWQERLLSDSTKTYAISATSSLSCHGSCIPMKNSLCSCYQWHASHLFIHVEQLNSQQARETQQATPAQKFGERAQSTWGNSMLRETSVGLDGFYKQRKRQKQADSSDTATEQEAQAFGQPAAAKKKQGPKQQAEATSHSKEDSSAAANNQTDAQVPLPAAAQSSKPKGSRCGTCKNEDRGKEGCLSNQAHKAAALAAARF